MGEENTSMLPDIITPVSDAIHQNLPETEKQADGVLSTVVGFFNNVVLYPVKKANLTFRYKLEAFEDDLKEKIKNIPEENLQVPPTMIAGPTLEALRYAYDETKLREMYENLLASAMDNRRASQVLPSFVDAIRQMEPLDAQVLKVVAESHEIISKHIRFCKAAGAGWYPSAMPYHFCESIVHLGDPFSISASISNLVRLGLVRTYETLLSSDVKESVKKHEYVNYRLAFFPVGSIKIEVEMAGTVITLDDYGKSFARICLAQEV